MLIKLTPTMIFITDWSFSGFSRRLCDVRRGRTGLLSAGCRRGKSSHTSGVPVLITNLLLHLRVRQCLQERGPEVKIESDLRIYIGFGLNQFSLGFCTCLTLIDFELTVKRLSRLIKSSTSGYGGHLGEESSWFLVEKIFTKPFTSRNSGRGPCISKVLMQN